MHDVVCQNCCSDILSFLDMREVVKTTCLLSNKWQYLWRSIPTLNFDNDDIDCKFSCCGCRRMCCECEACLLQRARFKYFVNKVFTRGSTSKLAKFQLRDTYHARTAFVVKWVNAALARKVQDVDISIDRTKILFLPHKLFSSDVKVLRLRLRCNARVPNLMCAAAWIKNLDLECVKLPDGNTNGELDMSFPVLESLVIEYCNVSHLKIISISTPVLETLKFRRFHTDKNSSCKVKTCTPNLKSLAVSVNISQFDSVVNYSMEDLSSLVSAEIFIRSGSKYVEECIKCWIEAVSWMYKVQDLKLPVSNVQLLLDNPKLLERLPGVFHNLKHVMIDMDGHKNFHTRALLKFLERAPHIKTLVLQGRDPSWYIPDKFEEERERAGQEWVGEDWIQSLPSFNHMVFFETRNFNGLNVEMKFLEFILEKAIVLKKMIIKTKKEWLQGKPCEEILSFSRASSCVSILFQVTELNAWELGKKRYYNIM
ncbi:hypothetical protein ACHQM5_011375 [Ranunculus cassubicifolius]